MGIAILGAMMPRMLQDKSNRFTQFIKQEFSQHEIIEEGLCGRTLCLDDPYDEDRNGTKNDFDGFKDTCSH